MRARDSFAVATLDAVVHRFAARGIHARLTCLCDHSAELHGRLSGRLAGAH